MRDGKIIKQLVEDVACLKTDIGWLKKLVYIGMGSSMTAALGVLGQIVLGMVRR